MKKTFAFLFLILSLTARVFAENVVVNGQDVGESVMIGDRVYVPLRSVGETMGAQVTWDDSTKTAYVNGGIYENIPKIVEEASEYTVGVIGRYSDEKGNEGVAYGSGFVISSDGNILTNAHVVSEMKRILVVMNDGNGYEAFLKNIDKEADIALLTIEKTGLKHARLADMSSVAPGQTVVAIGAPISFSLRNSATIGIISGLNRNRSNCYRLIQSDATLNHGNSGGPLINMNGEVVGMGTQGIVGVGVSGLYFSVTADTLKYALAQFEKYGRIRRPTLGTTLSESWLAEYDLPSDTGLEIKDIKKGSAAEKAGLEIGEAIVAVGDVYLNTIIDLNEALKSYLPGDSIPLKIKKGNSVFTVNVVAD